MSSRMLFSLYPTLTLNYFALCLVACLGTLQWIAARNNRLKISLLGPWGLGKPGTIVGAATIIAAFGWFFMTTPGLFLPGLAGGELSLLFGLAAVLALAITRLAGVFWQHKAKEEAAEGA